MDNTQIVAWWGAIVATLVLLWDVVKWLKFGPKIKKRVALNTGYFDGAVVSKEKIENGEVTTREVYCHVELVNVGTAPTTVMGISATHKPIKGKAQIGAACQAFEAHYGKHLPQVIAPGEVWSCRLPMSHYHSIHKHGAPEIHVSLSHLAKPLVVRARKSANKALKRDAEEFGAA
ncbi:MAG: hypothetical protein P1U64_05720 [Alcanivoracaceae bacterium]|nr:hypothetical protein [Alcanivoracaceae bacterium]